MKKNSTFWKNFERWHLINISGTIFLFISLKN